jgi:acyl carrier protein
MVVWFLKNTIFKEKSNWINKKYKNKYFMDREVVLEQLTNIVKPYVNDQDAFESITEETTFINDLKINSANLVDVILDIEEQFDILIDNESMERMLNVKSAIEIIEDQLSKK